MTRSAGPFDVRFHLSASENPHWYFVGFLMSGLTIDATQSKRTAKTKASLLNRDLAYWLKTEGGKLWLRSTGVLKESPRADGVGGK